MKNFSIIESYALAQTPAYQLVEEHIYLDKNKEGQFAPYRMAMTMELEEGEDDQYPLEDILDKFLVHVEEFLESTDEKVCRYVFGGEMDGIQKLKSLVGKRAYNQEYTDESGETWIKLVIE